jgi:hypothetical protein
MEMAVDLREIRRVVPAGPGPGRSLVWGAADPSGARPMSGSSLDEMATTIPFVKAHGAPPSSGAEILNRRPSNLDDVPDIDFYLDETTCASLQIFFGHAQV